MVVEGHGEMVRDQVLGRTAEVHGVPVLELGPANDAHHAHHANHAKSRQITRTRTRTQAHPRDKDKLGLDEHEANGHCERKNGTRKHPKG